ncbi:hypothetical protein DRP77_03265 [Candidatus Poribacteria bacterium]|nr:MAG: hypothetical protein DRP77_03265 [Candidatus Poribacteria bacterium]
MKRLKWGVLGASGVANRRTMPAINESKYGELHCLFSRSEEKAKALAEKHGAKRYYWKLEEFFADEEMDAVYIATPVYLHCEHVLMAAERGLHVLCEKPMAMNVEECRRMIDACKAKNLHLQICFLFRFHSCFQKIRSMVREGVLGEIVEARMPFLKWYPLPEGAWRRIPEQGGGGTLMDLGAHNVDLMRFVLDDEVEEVSAFCSSWAMGYEVEDTGTIMMRMRKGAHVICDTSFAAHKCDVVFEIYGTKGSVLVYHNGHWKVRTYIEGERREEEAGFENLYRAQIDHFAMCLAGKEEPIVTGEDGLINIKILQAAYESARTGKHIRIE